MCIRDRIEFESVVENVTYKVESDEATGLREIIIIESKDKTCLLYTSRCV